jgi:hypothetical protein
MSGQSSLLFVLVVGSQLAAPCLGDEAAQERRKLLLDQMQSLAGQTKIELAGSKRGPDLVKSPVFRYDDQPRRFIDATMWVWTHEGRPVALQKVEAKYFPSTGDPQWGFCFTSVSRDRLSVAFPADNRTFRSTEPGIAMRPLDGAPAVGRGAVQRKRQARELVREFSARVLMDPKNNITQEMRLLTTPIFEYSDSKSQEFAGAIYGFAANGTNPDLLVLLEVGGEASRPAWHFAPARMTSGGVTLKYDDAKVWEVPWVNWNEAPFPTWTFFAARRTPVPGEETP